MPVPPLASPSTHLRLATDVLDGMSRGLREAGGDAVSFRLPHTRLVLLAEPTAARELLELRYPDVRKSAVIRAFSDAIGDGLLTADDPVAAPQRKEIAPLLTPRHVARWADDMARVAERHLPPDGEVDVAPVLYRTALDVIGGTLFGEAGRLDAAALAADLDAWMVAFARDTNTWRRLLPERWRPGRAVRQGAVARLTAALREMAERRRVRGVEGDDLLGRLLAAEAAAGHRLDDEQLRAALLTVFVAGHETSAVALQAACWRLSRDPAVQALAREEALRLGPPRSPQELAARPVLRAIVDETLRLHPPAFGVGREVMRDLRVGGLDLPRGCTAIASFLALHRDPRWWREPLAFRPERWWNGEAEAVPKGAFLPFGAGPRVCVGAHFARLEMVVVLATWLARAELRPAGPDALRWQPAATLRPVGGVRVELRRRPPADRAAA